MGLGSVGGWVPNPPISQNVLWDTGSAGFLYSKPTVGSPLSHLSCEGVWYFSSMDGRRALILQLSREASEKETPEHGRTCMPGPDMGTKYGSVPFTQANMTPQRRDLVLTDPHRSRKPRCPPRWHLLRSLPIGGSCFLPLSSDTISMRGCANGLAFV